MARRVRPAAVAGYFYPADPRVLARRVDALLDAAEVPRGVPLAEAYVVPHAGYRYSGATAALVYARLRQHAQAIARVVVLGPSHRVPLRGCAVPVAEEWSTPLGAVRIDMDAARMLVAEGWASADDVPHAAEHSIEVQMPFLRRVLPPEVPILPVAVGHCGVPEALAAVGAMAGHAPGTVLLCSTDLSHYLDDESARRQDARTVQAVVDLAAERIGLRDACGVFGLRGLVGWAKREGLRAELLHRCTSADSTGDRERVVGYAAFAVGRPSRTGPPQ